MLKLFRVLRLQKLISIMQATDDVKVSLKLLKTIFLLLFYIHFTGCIWFYIGK